VLVVADQRMYAGLLAVALCPYADLEVMEPVNRALQLIG
jgi:hypothetical protein